MVLKLMLTHGVETALHFTCLFLRLRCPLQVERAGQQAAVGRQSPWRTCLHAPYLLELARSWRELMQE